MARFKLKGPGDFLQEMKKPSPFKIDAGARAMFFAGVPMAVMTLYMCISDKFMRHVTDKVWIYPFWGMVMGMAVLGMIAYNVTPKRFVLPIGITGWLIFFGVLFWKFWFGSLAFGHSHTEDSW